MSMQGLNLILDGALVEGGPASGEKLGLRWFWEIIWFIVRVPSLKLQCPLGCCMVLQRYMQSVGFG